MINPQWPELPISRINFHGPKDVRAIEVLLYKISPPLLLREIPVVDRKSSPKYFKPFENGLPLKDDCGVKSFL